MKTKKTITHKFLIRCLSILLAFCGITALLPTSVSAVTTDTYCTIKNVGSGKVLNVYGNKDANNTNVTLWDDDHTTGVHWKLINKGSAYVIVPECAPSRALNVYGNSSKAGNNVCLWSQTGHSTQGWILDAVNGGYVLRSENNRNLVLSADGSSNGSNVLIKTYNPSDRLQVWNFGSSTFIWPLANGVGSVTAPAGENRGKYIHAGTDIGAPSGTPILAIANGTVKATGFDKARGYFIVIEHGNYWCVYQHMQNPAIVGQGSTVSQGQTIGQVGNTGESFGAHLHFEIALTPTLSGTGSMQNHIYCDVNSRENITYYTVTKGANNTLNLNKV